MPPVPATSPPMLVDQWGRPIQRQALTQQFAAATLTGVRQPVYEGVSRGLTPQRLAGMMRAAEDNNPENYLALAEEMEEKDLHYVSVLGTRKRQVAQLPTSVQSPSKDAADVAITEAVQRDLIDSGVIDDYMFDMLDAVGKGFSLGEIMWNTSGASWKPSRIEYVDPRFIRFDRATMREPMLLDDQGIHQPLAPYKFLFLKLQAKSGIPIRGGLARNAAWAYLFKNFGLKDWVQFAEIYGLPLRLGKYPNGASEDDKDALLRAVSQIAVDAAGIIPANMEIDFVETANKASSADLYKLLLDYCDQQMSKAVLGQTGTTDSTGAKGLGSGTEHTEVREDIERADANAVSAVLSRQLVRPYVDLNFGPRQVYPWLRIGRTDSKDVAGMTSMAAQLVPLGLKVLQSDLRDAAGFTEPQPGDDILTMAAMPAPAPALPTPMTARQAATALAAAIVAENDEIDDAVMHTLSDWKEIVDPIGNQILALASKAKTADEFKAQLRALYPTIDTSAMASRLAILTFQTLGLGAIGTELTPHQVAAAAAGRAWQMMAARDLPIVIQSQWDGVKAGEALLDAARIGGSNPNYELARRGFLFCDAANPNQRGSYKDPFAVIDNGELKASSAAITLLPRFVARTAVSDQVRGLAMSLVASYRDRLEKQIKAS